jgi:hypothetical protein
MNTDDTTAALCLVLHSFCNARQLPCCSADELLADGLARGTLTADDEQWLRAYVTVWDGVQA